MTEKEKMEKGELYDAAIPELIEQLLSTRDKIFELNHLRPSQLEEREKLIREIIGTTPEKFIIISPFFCDYGHNIHLGKNFFANYNCVMLDEAPITIGDNVLIAPNMNIAGREKCQNFIENILQKGKYTIVSRTINNL